MSKKGGKQRARAGNRGNQGRKALIGADPDPGFTEHCSWITLQSNKEGFFRMIFEGVEDSLSKSQLATFGQLDSDQRRVAYLMGMDAVHKLSPVPMFRQKNPKEARDLMAQAENLLARGNSSAALNLLSRAITRANNSGELVSSLLGMRSRALSNLRQHELALRDTQMALSGGVPNSCARAHLLRTQGRCYFSLGDQMRAKLAYVSAQRLLDPKSSEFRELELEIEQCQYSNPNAQNKEEKSDFMAPELTGGANQTIPHTSLLLSVRDTPETGRYIVAKSKIDAGDVLAVEPAFCTVLLMDKAGTHCHHCLSRLVAPVGCPDCSGVAFCCRECQEVACKTYHKVECKYLNLFFGLGMSILCHLALRIITRTGSVRSFLKMSDLASTPSKGPEDKEVDSYRRFLRLVGHPEQRLAKDYLSRTLMAAFLLKCLKTCDEFWPADLSPQDEVRVGEALLRHICILQFNAHEVFETLARERTKIKGTQTNYIGVGVYLSVALFNHDCNPAVSRCFQGTKMILHALRPLQPGQMVGENYGPMYTKKSLAERQRSLRARYWFNCACQACSEKWNTFEQGVKSTVKEKNTEKMFDLGFEAMESGKLEGAIYLLSQFINSIDGLVLLPDREASLAIDSLRLCLMSQWGTVVVVQPVIKTQNCAAQQAESSVEIVELIEEEDQVN